MHIQRGPIPDSATWTDCFERDAIVPYKVGTDPRQRRADTVRCGFPSHTYLRCQHSLCRRACSDPNLMKLNLGCGSRKQPGFVNVDITSACSPDLVWDMEKTPWPWEDDSADSVLFSHSLEHVGADPQTFKEIIQELYRVCRRDADVLIRVPHPRHDDFINDPTHVRAITDGTFSLLSRRLNEEWIKSGAANTPLAIYWGVDFEIKKVEYYLDDPFRTQLVLGEITSDQATALARERNNVIKEIGITLSVVK